MSRLFVGNEGIRRVNNTSTDAQIFEACDALYSSLENIQSESDVEQNLDSLIEDVRTLNTLLSSRAKIAELIAQGYVERPIVTGRLGGTGKRGRPKGSTNKNSTGSTNSVSQDVTVEA